jgi:hypothetical protein
MKTIIFSLATMLILVACDSTSNHPSDSKKPSKNTSDTAAVYACPMHPEVTGEKGGKCPKCGMGLSLVKKPDAGSTIPMRPAAPGSTAAFSPNEIIAGYIQLKNTLAADNGKDAASAGNTLLTILAKSDTMSLQPGQKKIYAEIADDIRENAEHIGANATKIAHQREHFVMISQDVADLVKVFGSGGRTLYKDFCPMANDGKGATWISEVKEIKNPYLGSKMPDCGSVKETIK